MSGCWATKKPVDVYDLQNLTPCGQSNKLQVYATLGAGCPEPGEVDGYIGQWEDDNPGKSMNVPARLIFIQRWIKCNASMTGRCRGITFWSLKGMTMVVSDDLAGGHVSRHEFAHAWLWWNCGNPDVNHDHVGWFGKIEKEGAICH